MRGAVLACARRLHDSSLDLNDFKHPLTEMPYPIRWHSGDGDGMSRCTGPCRGASRICRGRALCNCLRQALTGIRRPD